MDAGFAGGAFVHFGWNFGKMIAEFDEFKVGDWLWVFAGIVFGKIVNDVVIGGAKA